MKATKGISELIRSLEKSESELKIDNKLLRDLNAALRLAEEKNAILNSIVDCSDDAIISKDLNGYITSWNVAAKRIFGYSEEEILGQSILKLIPQDRQHEEPKILEQLRKGIRVDHFETQRVRKDGTLIYVSLTISPIKNSNGVIVGLSKIARDITAQRASEADSRRLSAIVESSDDAIISKDLNSIITSWNAAATRIFGYEAQEMIGASILKLIPADRQDEEPHILSQLKQGLRVDHFETIRKRKDGSSIHVSLTISPIKNAKGEVIGLSKIARDITDKKNVEQKKDEFIGFVSHELKTPLTSLRSYIQVSLAKAKGAGYDFITNALTRAELQTRKMEQLITDFLNVSRLEDGQLSLKLTSFDLVELLKGCVYDATLGSKHEIEYQGESFAQAEGDPEKIALVIVNLISNAQKYTPQPSKILVRCEKVSSKYRVSIQDFGIGISADEQKNVFNKFHRIESEQTKFTSGFGIGLYLVNAIITLHQSSIQIKSELGAGSTFSFELEASKA